jgi:general secretion pathway protein D
VSTNSSSSSSTFANSLPGGLSYFGNIGPNWDVALQAAAADSTTSVIQRPRIQTSQAKAAAFFVGQTVPYVTGSTYGSAYGNSSSYSQLSVGVELDVTPFINPDGLVVMDINQEIDDLNGYTHIDNVGDVPNTTKRTLSSEIAVRDRDTIILGGFVRSDKSKSKSGVPLLMDIPILGNLFTSRNDSKDRSETIVMIRPTVLKTPEIAAAQAVKEERRLPGISAAAAEDAESERKQVEAERRAELRRVKAQGHIDDRFNPVSPNVPVDTNRVSFPNP